MGKGYYIIGSFLIGVGTFFLYNKIKNGNVNFNIRNQDYVIQVVEGSHLNTPMEDSSLLMQKKV